MTEDVIYYNIVVTSSLFGGRRIFRTLYDYRLLKSALFPQHHNKRLKKPNSYCLPEDGFALICVVNLTCS